MCFTSTPHRGGIAHRATPLMSCTWEPRPWEKGKLREVSWLSFLPPACEGDPFPSYDISPVDGTLTLCDMSVSRGLAARVCVRSAFSADRSTC